MNVVKDITIEGRILDQIKKTVEYLETQVKEHVYLGQNGTFVTDREYPKFVIQEMVVNAICHRDYSIKGTEIQIKMFDDRLVFESPGRLPSIVRTDNIRHTHFSRNPKIAEYLKSYDYVKEFGEGVDRMCRELSANGIREPQYNVVAFIMKATVYANQFGADNTQPTIEKGHEKGHEKLLAIIQADKSISIPALADRCKISVKAVRIILDKLKTEGVIRRIGPAKGGYWEVLKSLGKDEIL